jgi:hypothetical protein
MPFFHTAPWPDLNNSPYGLYNIWNAASVILGFQLVAFTWRMTRERDMNSRGKPTWFPFADMLNLAAIVVNIGGTFLAPIFGIGEIHPAGALALSLILFAAYPFALAGHYELFWKDWGKDEYFPKQERIVVGFVVLLLIGGEVYLRHYRLAIGLVIFSLLAACFLILKRRTEKKQAQKVSAS